MAFVIGDRIQETTNSPGTGTATLLGAVSGYQSFSTGIGANNTTYYVIADQLGTNWEVGLGALNSTGTVLTRTTVYSSSNGGSTVNFATGTQYVWCDYPSSKAVLQGNPVNFSSIGATTAGTGAFTTLSASSTVSGAGFSNYFAAPPTIGNTTPNAGAFTTLSASSTVSGTGFSNYLASPPAIGNTTPNAGTFTALVATSITDSGLTSGRVNYATTGGLLTDSANMTFSGTALTLANDASISGLTVGKGGGAVGTNTVFGASAFASNSSGNYNVALGFNSLNANTASNNTAIGTGSLATNSSGGNNVAVGYNSLNANTTAGNNTAIGFQSLGSNTTASSNTAVGYQSLFSNTTAANNVAIGWTALYSNITGINNCAIGTQALYANTGASNTGIGTLALTANTSGANNVALGQQALAANTTASSNTAVGYQAGGNITTGGSNTIVGQTAGVNLTTGVNNVYLGINAGASSAAVAQELHITTSTGGVGKGSNTGYINVNGGGVYQGNNSTLWAIISDQRLKKNIVDNTDGLNKITAIQVRNFEYRTTDEVTELEPQNAIDIKGVQLGAIAQELQAILPDCVKTESTGVMSVDANNLTWYLINAVKELNAKVTALEAQLAGAK